MKKVSIICCTEDRLEFMPWLAHVYESMAVPKGWEKELVVVDSTLNSEEVYDALEQIIPASQLRYGCVDHGMPLGQKRNHGLDMMNGDICSFLDDDDAKAPRWLSWAIETLGNKDVLAVKTKVMFMNIALEPIRVRWVGTKWYSAGLYSRKAIETVHFEPHVPVGEDVRWQGQVWARMPKASQVHVLQEGVGFALTHTRNIANRFAKPGRWKHKDYAPDLWRPEMWTPGEWEITLQEVTELRRRLGYIK